MSRDASSPPFAGGRNISRTFLAKKRGGFTLSHLELCFSFQPTHSPQCFFLSPRLFLLSSSLLMAAHRWRGGGDGCGENFGVFLASRMYTFREHCFDCTCMYTYWVSLWHFGPCAAVWAPGQIARGASLFFLPQLGSEDGTSAQSPSPTLKDITD